ncbi:MAG: transcriptional repressor LexA [Burkholderiales bacterium]|jgi:repressor LexA|uniref:transcriptional repressor LexA n=1 Tax=Comamonas denitrificans TaxID=117506 RepID=UPI002C577890|nr:transcriptional repressor LexA [Comamonas sp.]MCZ2106831.1 transcriptional repressor LexA [Burkholderiales bacterium]HRL39125.1 transcriptional repressor LexA [Comamonas denitrificans]HRL97330.1 transcriptional repressor LexA [Comamonas denitrificans]HRM66800.1 transcriptional repressor LexA [Comamonas denitrificans]
MALPKLTARQQEVLELIQTSITATGAPPTRAEIAQALGFKSANAAEEHLKALARKGAIELVSGTSRGIRLRLHAAQEQVTQLASTLVLPLIGRVAAGSPILAQEHIDTTHSVPESMFERRPDYLLRVRGMSMRDLGILDGDLLAVQATQQARSGQIVVARLDDEVTVKRLELLPSGARLHPANPDYPIIEVRDAESFAIEGLAVGLVRPGL